MGQYKGIEVEKQEYNVTDEMVNAEIERERENVARMIDVERPVENGDEVELDYSGTVDGVKFEGGTAEHQTLVIGSGMFIPGFEEQMIGMNVGEEKDLNVKFPDEYHSDELKGKDAVFHVKVHAVRVKELPEADDEFAKDVSEFNTIAELRDHKKEELEKKAMNEAKAKKENDVIEKAVANATVDIPDVMIDRQADRMLNDIRYRLSMQGISLEDYCKYTGTKTEVMKAEMKNEAERRVKTQLVLDAIMKAEGIKAENDEVDKKIDEYCAQASEIEVTPLRLMPVSATAVPPIVTLKVPSVIALMLSGRVLTAAALNAAERTKAAAAFLWERHMYSWVGFRKLLL